MLLLLVLPLPSQHAHVCSVTLVVVESSHMYGTWVMSRHNTASLRSGFRFDEAPFSLPASIAAMPALN